MESFTHDEFIRAMQMEGKELHHGGDDKTQKRIEAAREKQLKETRQRRAAPSSSDTTEYSHEMFIEALRMEGKAPRVTPDSLEREAQKKQEIMNRKADVAYKKKSDGLTLAQQWEKEHEAEEIKVEQEARKKAKEAAAAVARSSAPPTPTPIAAAPEAPTTSTEVDPNTNVLLQPDSHKSVRNHVLTVAFPPTHTMLSDIKSKAALTSVATLPEANSVLTSHLNHMKAIRSAANLTLSVNIVICYDPAAAGITLDDIGTFIAALHTKCQLPEYASRPPGVAIYAINVDKGDSQTVQKLSALNQPPYTICAVNPDNISRYLQANGADFEWADEASTLGTLVNSANRTDARSVLIKTGIDHDLGLSSAASVGWLEIQMHWKGCFDLDLSCILLNRMGGRCGMVYFANLEYGKGAFAHSGDIMTAPKGDKECIQVSLVDVPSEVKCMYFVSNSYSGEPFSDVEAIDASVMIADKAAGKKEVFTQFPVTGKGEHLAVVLCRVFRTGLASWGVTKIDMPHAKADTARALVPSVQAHFREHSLVSWESDVVEE